MADEKRSLKEFYIFVYSNMKYFIKPKHNRRLRNSPISSSTQRPNVPHGLALPAELVPII
jgi:hypothetical protein